jgi:hypothetical protein
MKGLWPGLKKLSCQSISIRVPASMVSLTEKDCPKRKSNQESFMGVDQRFYNHFSANQYYSLGNEKLCSIKFVDLLRRLRIRSEQF